MATQHHTTPKMQMYHLALEAGSDTMATECGFDCPLSCVSTDQTESIIIREYHAFVSVRNLSAAGTGKFLSLAPGPHNRIQEI